MESGDYDIPAPWRPGDPLMEARLQFGLPLRQQMVKLYNASRTWCYANAGTNALFSAPAVNDLLLRLPPGAKGLLNILKGLVSVRPEEGAKSLQALHMRLTSLVPAATFTDANRQQDAAEWITTLVDAATKDLGNLRQVQLQREWCSLFRITTVEDLQCRRGHKRSLRDNHHVCFQLPVVDTHGVQLPSVVSSYRTYMQASLVYPLK